MAGLTIAASQTAPLDSQHAGMFWPWYKTDSSYLNTSVYLPPSNAYLQARVQTDNEVGPWRAAAGFKHGKVSATGLEYNPRREDRDELLGGSNRVNPLSDFQSVGVVVYGNRTLSRVSGPLDSLHVLSMLVYVKKLIATSVQYLQFEPNDPVTWRDFVQTVNPILQSVAAGRGLETFSVKCDAETNPPELRAQKTMRGVIFLKHVDAAETIEIDFALQSTGAAEFSI
jgi:phage tail sheath protein FI